MLQQLFTQVQNYALILLLFALLAYSLIGFSIDVSATQAEALPPERVSPSARESIEQRADQMALADPARTFP